MGQSRPLFVYLCPFLITISIQIEKSVDGVLGIRTRGLRICRWRRNHGAMAAALILSYSSPSPPQFGPVLMKLLAGSLWVFPLVVAVVMITSSTEPTRNSSFCVRFRVKTSSITSAIKSAARTNYTLRCQKGTHLQSLTRQGMWGTEPSWCR